MVFLSILFYFSSLRSLTKQANCYSTSISPFSYFFILHLFKHRIRGSFSIHDDLKHEELNLQIQAHPPSRVCRKVYELSKRMPEVLHLELVPCKKFWLYFFQEYFPDRRDVGLYFFSTDRERSEDYISLLESISVKNLALRKQIDDVELLVFTSKLLPVDCQRCEGKYFLWGVFHRLKRDPTARLDNRGLRLSVEPSDDPNNGHNQGDNSEVIDMEIDMIGGVNVGKMDVSIQREPLKEDHISFREESGSAKQISVSRDTGAVTRVPSLSDKMEPFDDIPPGFEEAFRLRVQNSFSTMKNSVVGGKSERYLQN